MFLKIILFFIISLNFSYSMCHVDGTSKTESLIKQQNNQMFDNKEVALLEFLKVWARASIFKALNTESNNNSAIYLVIRNNSDSDYKLVNVYSDVANKAELHKSFVNEKGVSKMVKLDNFVIPAHSDAEFKPGGAHIMLYDLKRSLNVGDKFTLSLFFDNKTQQNIEVEVFNR